MNIKAIDTTADIAKETLPFILKGIFVLGIGWLIYSKYTNRFVKMKENSKYPKSNISDAQAKAHAVAIVSSMTTFGNSFETVSANLTGLNYNAFVKVYNEFGHQSGTFLSGDLDLIEWLQNQFSDYEIQQLSFLLNGAFFKSSQNNSNEINDLINLICYDTRK